MRLAPAASMAEWLERLEGRPADFDWDAGNRTKHRKHGVGPADIEGLLESPVVFAGRIVEPKHDEPRWLMLGRSRSARTLALIFTRRGSRLRPVSCRSMRRNERKVYEEAIRER